LAVALILAGIFFIGWAVMNHRSNRAAPPSLTAPTPPARTVVSAQPPETAPTTAAATSPEAAETAPSPSTPTTVPPPALNPLPIPKLQGIFYSPSAPSAIIDGKSVQRGDQIHGYTVKAIARSAVTLIGPDQKEVQLDMGN
jgi:hypothetical protein